MTYILLTIMNYWWIWIITFIIWIIMAGLFTYKINVQSYSISLKKLYFRIGVLTASYIGALISGWLTVISIVLYIAKFVKYNL